KGKILNVERARIDKVLSNEEIRAIITAIGAGIRDDFDLGNARYHKVIIMSVDAAEHVFVRTEGGVRMTEIGPFVDGLLEEHSSRPRYAPHCEKREGGDLGDVLCFDVDSNELRFRPIKGVLRHPIDEALYEIRTAYGRTVRVTASHSVFVEEDGQIGLRRGDSIHAGQRLVAPRKVTWPETAPARIDLLAVMAADPECASQVVARGPAVEAWYRARVEAEYAGRPEWSEARVSLSEDARADMAAARRASGIANAALCEAVGIRQPVTFYGWERGSARPTLTHLEAYLDAIGASREDVLARSDVGPSRLQQTWRDQYRAAPSNRVRDYVNVSELTPEDVAWFGERDDLTLTPRHHATQGLPRHLPVGEALATLLGFYVAEGSVSVRGGIRFAIGARNAVLVDDLVRSCEAVFGLTPQVYEGTGGRVAELRIVNRVAALAWGRLFGFQGARAHTKRIPDLVFELPQPAKQAFVRGYFLGDGTLAPRRLAFTTTSRELASGLSYLLSGWGVVASLASREPDGVERSIRGAPCVSRHSAWTVSVSAREDIETLRFVWEGAPGCERIEAFVASEWPTVNRRFRSL
ncbi:MAG: DNA gyrase subunit B, partial [Gemmatimonadetes bacterium]|nr:DNA gyrase subunit B [Gemmatimonadota bacterium]